MKNKIVSTNYQVTKSEHDPVKRGDNITLTRKVKSRGPGPDVIIDKPPRKSLDERITEALTKALEPVVSQLKEHDEFNKVVKDYMEFHP
ncbi:MAG: hypothetical protein LBJ97_02140 [Mycoplasmataceae bacterium]|jgi:hypothetical protein|nr:hypothetical protein [Mycoplasmataceae bacterium]